MRAPLEGACSGVEDDRAFGRDRTSKAPIDIGCEFTAGIWPCRTRCGVYLKVRDVLTRCLLPPSPTARSRSYLAKMRAQLLGDDAEEPAATASPERTTLLNARQEIEATMAKCAPQHSLPLQQCLVRS